MAIKSALQRFGRSLRACANKSTYRAGLILAVYLFVSLCLRAEEQERSLAQYSERLFTTEQGLPQNEVRSIAQTPDGYLWFGTRDGLARFDGVRFTVFRQETTPGIGHNMFGAMLVDHLGRLWIATGDGLSCYEHGRFTRYTEHDGLPTNAIHSLLEDRSGRLWIGTWNGLALFDGSHFRGFTRKDGLPANSISGLADDGAAGLWVGTYGGGVAHWVDGHFRVLTEKDGLPSNFIQTVFHDRAGRVWVGTLKGSALLTSAGRIELLRDLPGKAITFYEDRSGTVWAATDKTFGRYRGAPESTFERQEGPNQDVETLLEDRDGSLWVGTSDAGVARYRSGIFVPYTEREGLADDRANTIFQDSKGDIWIGGASGLSRKSGKAFYTIAEAQFGGGPVRSIAEGDNGDIWVGTSNGIARFNGRSWSRLSSRDHIPIEVHVLYRDRAGRMWIGSPSGITIWDHGRISTLTQKDGLPGNYVMSLLEDGQGVLWAGTITGLARIAHGTVTSYTTADGLLSNYIQCLYEDTRGTLWICTPSGLHRFRNGRFRAFTMKDGMFADSVLQLLEDGQHRFWISSYRGVFRVDRDDLDALASGTRTRISSIAYGREDGMKSSACSGLGMQPAGWMARDKTLWFPTDMGIVKVDPLTLPAPDPPPVPLLETVLRDGVESTGINVGPDVHRIDFLFTAPTSIGPEEVEFRYRMRGYENEWHDVAARRQISFTNLARGDYRFAIEARRGGGQWSAEEASWSLHVFPHFYETRWFFAFCCLLVLLLIWLAHSLRVRATRERLSTIMGERGRVAQELHDTLLQSVSGTAMEIRSALRHFGQGSAEVGCQQLSLALDHLGQSMADARQAIWDLRSPEAFEIRLDQALEAAAQRVCAGGPRLNYAISGEPRALASFLGRHAYRIGIEAIANAVQHSQCTEVSVSLQYEINGISLVVRDNGSGFDPAFAEVSGLSNHWGLTGMKERASQCCGQLTIKSATGLGTSVVFEAPLTLQVR